jgi:hypothetical protein
MARGRKPKQQTPTYRLSEPVKFLLKRHGPAVEIDAEVTCLTPLSITYLSLGTKEYPSGGGMRCSRVLRTPSERARIRPLQLGEQPTVLPDPEQALLDAAWQGEIDGMSTSEIAKRYDLARSRANHVLAYIMQGKSPDLRFGKPVASTYHDKRALISQGRLLTREPLERPYNEYRWVVRPAPNEPEGGTQ